MSEFEDLPKSKKEAEEKGSKYYFTGNPCKHGHISKRYVLGQCMECQSVCYDKNKDKIQKQMREYRKSKQEDKNKIRESKLLKNRVRVLSELKNIKSDEYEELNKLSISKDKAYERGDNYYFPGKACSKGHVSKRSVSRDRCHACASEYEKNRWSKIKKGRISSDYMAGLSELKDIDENLSHEVALLPNTAKQAREIGSKYYFTGKKCRHGHLSIRLASDNSCAICNNSDQYRVLIREKHGSLEDILKKIKNDDIDKYEEYLNLKTSIHDARQSGDKYYFNGIMCKNFHISKKSTRNGQCYECEKQWIEANRADYIERSKCRINEYRHATRDKFRFRSAKRRAMKIGRIPGWADMDKIMTIYTHSIFMEELCGMVHEVDHIIPLQGETVCGLHVHYNMQILPMSLNRSKANNVIIDMQKWIEE